MKLKWYFHIAVISPFMVASLLMLLATYLSCSEYDSFNGENCTFWESILGIDLYWTTVVSFFILCIISIPVFAVGILIYGGIVLRAIGSWFSKYNKPL